MAADQAGYRLYQDLAAWWPLISPPEEYAEEAAFAGGLLREAERPVRTVLELGSGGGHCASHLAPGFSMTLVDLSPGMLEVSRRLNPDCEHVEADMRTVRLGRDFDAVFVHDAVDYMTTEDDLRLVIGTAFMWCTAATDTMASNDSGWKPWARKSPWTYSTPVPSSSWRARPSVGPSQSMPTTCGTARRSSRESWPSPQPTSRAR